MKLPKIKQVTYGEYSIGYQASSFGTIHVSFFIRKPFFQVRLDFLKQTAESRLKFSFFLALLTLIKGPTADIVAVGSKVKAFYDLGPPGGPLKR